MTRNRHTDPLTAALSAAIKTVAGDSITPEAAVKVAETISTESLTMGATEKWNEDALEAWGIFE